MRMDVRRFTPIPLPSDSANEDPNGDSVPKIAFGPDLKKMDADVQELVTRSEVDAKQVSEALTLQSWTTRQWDPWSWLGASRLLEDGSIPGERGTARRRIREIDAS